MVLSPKLCAKVEGAVESDGLSLGRVEFQV